MAAMKAEIKGENLVVTIPLLKPLKPSKTGRTLLVATSAGNKEVACKVNGQNIRIGLNAFVYPSPQRNDSVG